jgi:hypothetical protein
MPAAAGVGSILTNLLASVSEKCQASTIFFEVAGVIFASRRYRELQAEACKEEAMRKLASYVRKYDRILGPGAGERLYRNIQRKSGLSSGIKRTLEKARRLGA